LPLAVGWQVVISRHYELNLPPAFLLSRQPAVVLSSESRYIPANTVCASRGEQ